MRYILYVSPFAALLIVIVPVDDFYDIGKIYEVLETFDPNPNINYKDIVCRINPMIEKFENEL